VASERVERRLTAILAADVAGYSRLMGEDEEGTLAQLKAHRRALVDPKISEHRGRIVKTTGDGMLVEFASVVDAVRCAADIQRGMIERNAQVPQEKRIKFRVGINVGDIIIDGGDVSGDGVNVVARLEGIAEPGGICVSARVQEYVQGQLDIVFEDLGELELKNIVRSVRAYRVRLEGESVKKSVPKIPDMPSIAVLPFRNLSGDPEQEYLADGIVEDITMALSRFRWLFVIARNSSFTFKDRVVDVRRVGHELGVRYVLAGSVRKAGNRLRIAGQLIDASLGTHLWANSFDGELEDIFELQDQVTAKVVSVIAPELERAEIERAKRKPTESLDAYEYYMRGIAKVRQHTKEGYTAALQLFCRAVELDPEFASAYGRASGCYVSRKGSGWMTNPVQEIADAARLAGLAVELGKDDAVALTTGGFALAYVVGELDAGAAYIDRALAINPNFSQAWYYGALTKIWLGNPELAIERLERAMRLNPLDRLMAAMQSATAYAHFCAGRHDEASLWAGTALRDRPRAHAALRVAAASHALAGRQEEEESYDTITTGRSRSAYL
jgi:TolB-like protein